jgi:hypothetical protein
VLVVPVANAVAVDAVVAFAVERVTTPEKLHRLVDELNDAEVVAALVRLERERDAFLEWANADDPDAARRPVETEVQSGPLDDTPVTGQSAWTTRAARLSDRDLTRRTARADRSW